MTPIYKINLNGSNVWAKLENQNPTGTHKDRSMARWIAYHASVGTRELAISSSGNSAISAAKYCQEFSIILHAFVSPKIHSEKIARITAYEKAVLHRTKTPNKDSFRFCKEREIPNLRASKDDMALEGYKDIALELAEQLPYIDNLFIPTSSGATLEGIYKGYQAVISPGTVPGDIRVPAFFVIQTARVHPIADYFDKNFSGEEVSRATAIVDKVAHRRDRVAEVIKETGGGGFVIVNEELQAAKKMVVNAGWQSALAFAGFLKWQRQNLEKSNKQTSVCLFTD